MTKCYVLPQIVAASGLDLESQNSLKISSIERKSMTLAFFFCSTAATASFIQPHLWYNLFVFISYRSQKHTHTFSNKRTHARTHASTRTGFTAESQVSSPLYITSRFSGFTKSQKSKAETTSFRIDALGVFTKMQYYSVTSSRPMPKENVMFFPSSLSLSLSLYLDATFCNVFCVWGGGEIDAKAKARERE